jgi:hypothetical protein
LSKRPLIVATASLAIALAGCGSSSKTTSSAAPSSSASASSSTAPTSSATTASSTGAATGAGGAAAFKSGFGAEKVQLTALGATLRKALTQAGSKTDAQLATELSQLSDRAKAQAQKLSQLNPSAKLKTAHDNLVKALNAVSSDLKAISEAATKHDAAEAKAATEKLVADAAAVRLSDTQLTKGLGLPAS